MRIGRRSLLIIGSTALLFFVVTMPFRRFFQLLSVTEVRPASAFNPVFGLLFGPPGALGCALGNLLADVLSGYSFLMCALGVLAQLFYGLLPWALWRWLGGEMRLNTSRRVLRYMLIMLLDTAGMAVILTLLMRATDIPAPTMTTLLLFLNNFVFCMVLGIPLFVAISSHRLRQRGEGVTLTERFVLMFLLMAILTATIIGFIAYHELSSIYLINRMALWNRIYIYISLDLFVFCVVILFVLRYIERNISIPMEALAQVAGDYIATEDDSALDTAAIVRRCEAYVGIPGETGALAVAFRDMAVDLERYIDHLTRVTAERERIGAELSVATKIQADMLPNDFPAFPERREFDIFASMTPAKEVGGDFYDFFLVDDDHLAVVIADVSDKGVPAALFMVITKTLIKNQALMGRMPAEILEEVNAQLCENNKEKMFVTVWLGLLELSSGTLVCANAGHEYPALRQNGAPFALYKDKHGLVLAGMKRIKYRQYTLTLEPGDAVFVYTDGVPESIDAKEEFFGTTRMLDTLNDAPDASPEQLIARVEAAITRYSEGAPQFDDITMLALRYNGKDAQTLHISAEVSRWPEVLEALNTFLEDCKAPPKARTQLAVACEEIFVNIASYAYGEAGGEATVRFAYDAQTQRVCVTFVDGGQAFDPLAAETPDITLAPDKRRMGGLGILMVRRTMDAVHYTREDGKNILTLEKQLSFM